MRNHDESTGPVANVSPAVDWISPQESDRRLKTAVRLTALEKSVSALEDRRMETKWWIRTMILLASAVAGAIGVLVSVVNRWLP